MSWFSILARATTNGGAAHGGDHGRDSFGNECAGTGSGGDGGAGSVDATVPVIAVRRLVQSCGILQGTAGGPTLAHADMELQRNAIGKGGRSIGHREVPMHLAPGAWGCCSTYKATRGRTKLAGLFNALSLQRARPASLFSIFPPSAEQCRTVPPHSLTGAPVPPFFSWPAGYVKTSPPPLATVFQGHPSPGAVPVLRRAEGRSPGEAVENAAPDAAGSGSGVFALPEPPGDRQVSRGVRKGKRWAAWRVGVRPGSLLLVFARERNGCEVPLRGPGWVSRVVHTVHRHPSSIKTPVCCSSILALLS